MENTEITIHCEAGFGYVGFVASVSVDNHGYHQRTTLSEFTPELSLVATDVKADAVMDQVRRNGA